MLRGDRVGAHTMPVTERDVLGSQDYPHGAGIRYGAEVVLLRLHRPSPRSRAPSPSIPGWRRRPGRPVAPLRGGLGPFPVRRLVLSPPATMDRKTGLEPATLTLARWCFSPEWVQRFSWSGPVHLVSSPSTASARVAERSTIARVLEIPPCATSSSDARDPSGKRRHHLLALFASLGLRNWSDGQCQRWRPGGMS